MSTGNLFGGKGRPARKADNLTAIVGRVSRKCGRLDVSQPYGPPRPVTGIVLLLPSRTNKYEYNILEQMIEKVLLHLTRRTTVMYGSNLLSLDQTIMTELNCGCCRI
jgi:hypothetical protein